MRLASPVFARPRQPRAAKPAADDPHQISASSAAISHPISSGLV
jgi:hypothetical protein